VQNLGAREQRRSRYGLLSLSHQANSIEFKLGLRKRLQLGWGICGWPFAQSAYLRFDCLSCFVSRERNDSEAMFALSFSDLFR
jgi:hypothetical protein